MAATLALSALLACAAHAAPPAAPAGYLPRVGPAPIRLVAPLRPVGSPSGPTNGPVAAARTPDPSPAPEAPQFYGPPAPMVTTPAVEQAAAKPEPAPPAVEPAVEPAAPVAPTTVSISDPAPQQAVTAQMLVRFFRNQPAGGALTNLPPQSGPGTETSIWVPVQFVPPQNSGPPPSSSATYQVLPPR